MSTIGIDLEPAQLVLQKDRDFKWAFQNVDAAGAATDYPDGDLFFEIYDGGEHNTLYAVEVLAATGGTYKFSLGSDVSTDIDYYDVTNAPQAMDGDIQDAIEDIASVGVGNVYVHPAKLIPVWRYSLTLNTGNNEKQSIRLPAAATGGTFRLAYGSQVTANITFGATDATVQAALEALAGIGSGNVTVTKTDDFYYELEFIGSMAATNVTQVTGLAKGAGFGLTGVSYSASIQTQTVVPGTSKLTEQFVNTLNKTVNDVFNSFEDLLGVDINYRITSATNIVITVTGNKSYKESDVLTFAVTVTAGMITGFLNQITSFVGLVNTTSLDFFWNHYYQVEFINDLGNTELPAFTSDITNLVGVSGEKDVKLTMLAPGKAPTTKWPFTISGSTATIKVESEAVNKILPRTRWNLVFLPDGEPAGGDPVARGRVSVQE